MSKQKFEWDFFVSHAWEDKVDFVAPLVKALKDLGAKVWYDENEIDIGESISESVQKGLKASRFGIIVLSEVYVSKEWARKELSYFLAAEVELTKRILPIWHKISPDKVRELAPLLADRRGADSTRPLSEIANLLHLHLSKPASAIASFFDVKLPENALQQLIIAFTKRASATGGLPSKGRRALVVDDHPLMRDAVVMTLAKLNVECIEADRLDTAISILKSNPDIQLLILDLKLPDTTGISGVILMREAIKESFPIIVYSASPAADMEEPCIEAGADYFCEKSMSSAELYRVFSDMFSSTGIFALCVYNWKIGALNYAMLKDCGIAYRAILKKFSSTKALDLVVQHKVRDILRNFCMRQYFASQDTTNAAQMRGQLNWLKRTCTYERASLTSLENTIKEYLNEKKFIRRNLEYHINLNLSELEASIFDCLSASAFFLQLSLIELIDNALDSNAEEISIEIEGRVRASHSDYVVLTRNSGPPISERHASTLFSNGSSSKGQGRGAGLSLICALGSAHHAKILLSERNPVSFLIQIPIDSGDNDEPEI